VDDVDPVTQRERRASARPRPLQNRVTPFGEIAALPGRGTLTGNRGILHDDVRRIVRPWQVRRWIACRLDVPGRRRELMRPHTWTELFFLDEAAAFAAGHRPCAACRHADYQRFKALWVACHGGLGRADDIDARLHADRLIDRTTKRIDHAELQRLPDGTYVLLDGVVWLVFGAQLLAWSDHGYTLRRARPANARVDVLTPSSVVAILSAGYLPQLHPSARAPVARPG
jgi:hypothetical protein